MPEVGSIAHVVLAAGAGRRFGGRKLDAVLQGKALGRWATDAVEQAGAVNRFIVLGAETPDFAATLDGWTIIANPHANKGIGTSLHAAIGAVRDYGRLVVALADMPFVEAAHLQRLADGEGAMFTRHPDGRPGVPAAFPQALFAMLLDLPDDRGAAALAGRIDAELVAPGSPATLMDIDTRAALVDVSRAAKRR